MKEKHEATEKKEKTWIKNKVEKQSDELDFESSFVVNSRWWDGRNDRIKKKFTKWNCTSFILFFIFISLQFVARYIPFYLS